MNFGGGTSAFGPLGGCRDGGGGRGGYVGGVVVVVETGDGVYVPLLGGQVVVRVLVVCLCVVGEAAIVVVNLHEAIDDGVEALVRGSGPFVGVREGGPAGGGLVALEVGCQLGEVVDGLCCLRLLCLESSRELLKVEAGDGGLGLVGGGVGRLSGGIHDGRRCGRWRGVTLGGCLSQKVLELLGVGGVEGGVR